MAENSTKPPSTDSPTSSHGDWLYRLGYLQATCDDIKGTVREILTHVTATRSTEPQTTSGLMARLKEAGNAIVLVSKLWGIWRRVSWPVSIPLYAWFAAKWLGWL